MEGQEILDNPLVIATGAINVDYIHSVDEVTLDGESYIQDIWRFSGGSASNTARYLQRWGISTMITGTLGDDEDGRFYINELKKNGVCLYLKIRSGHTGRANIFVDRKGRRSIYLMPGVNLQLKKEDLPQGEILNMARWVHATSLVGDEAMDSQISWLMELPEHIKISFSPGMIYSRFGYKRFISLLNRTEIAFFNMDEIKLFTGLSDIMSSVGLLHRCGVKLVSISMGSDGSILSSIEYPEPHHQKAHAKEVIDTVGAGDALSAGIIYGMIKDLPLQEIHLLGAISASFAVRSRGAHSMIPSIEDIMMERDSLSIK